VAIKQAKRNVEELRDEFTQGLTNEIAKIEALVDTTAQHLPENALKSGIDLSGIIFNLAGALGYSRAQAIAASLHDLLVVMSEKELRCVEPVLIHAMAARCAAPGKPQLSKKETEQLLDHLNKIIVHFREQPDPCNKSNCQECPGAVHCR
jgi:hypothetical protein